MGAKADWLRWQIMGTSALSVLGFGAMGLPGVAVADPVLSATAQYSLNGATPPTTVPNPATPPNDILPSATDNTNTVFGHVYSYANGINGSRSSGNNTYSINGTSDYTNTFTNTGGAPAYYSFNFTISAGDLGVYLDSSSTGSQQAMLSAAITVNGVSAFNYQSSMSLTSGGSVAFSESGATLNPAGATITGNSGDYTWNDYTGSVFLGTLAPGQSVTVDYTLFSSAIGSMTSVGTSCNGGYLASVVYGYLPGPCISDALARIGDPFNGAGTPTLAPASFGFANVPEPASMALLGGGLASLALSRRRRRV